MSSKPQSASRWLNKEIATAKYSYIYAAVLTFLSAGSFVAFCWYLTRFAALWLSKQLIQPENLLIAIVFLFGRYVFAHFASQFSYNAGSLIVTQMKKKLYPLLLKNSKFDSVSSTLFITKISDDLKPYYAFFIPYAMSTAIVSILLLIICFWLEIWVGFALLVSLLVIPMQMMIIGVGSEELHKKHINLFMRYSSVFYNRLQTIAEIVNLDNFKAQYNFLSKKSEALNKATTSVMRVAILSSAVLELFVTICIAAIAIYLGMSLLGIMNGPNYGKTYDFHLALFLLTLSPYFFFYLRKFVSAYHDRNRALAAAKLLMPLLDELEEESDLTACEKLSTIEIRNLNFAYPGSPIKVLNQINVQFPTKGLVLVKGISGSGKSTLLKILTGSLSISEGLVSVNKKHNNWSQQWLKQHSSYMNQFPFIFDGTLHYNVFLENDDEAQYNSPVFLNKIVDKKEKGWQTLLSHNGKQLSGGERQLITLARLMTHPKPVAILDEPTANLDTDMVNIILEQIVQLSANCLVILASHESMFEKVADTIVNLNWGEQLSND